MALFLYYLTNCLAAFLVLPIKDNRGRHRSFPWMTATIVAINVLVHILVFFAVYNQPRPPDQPDWLPLYPFMIVSQLIADGEGLGALSALTSIFLHGSWSHLLGNMFFLWFFGRKVEDMTGPLRFALFYLLVGFTSDFISVMANIFVFPTHAGIPALGASGAISGVMGAYLFLFSEERIRTFVTVGCLIPIPIPFRLPAWAFLVFQFLKDALVGQLTLELAELGIDYFSGVGIFAHMGGIVSGLLFIFLFLHPETIVQRR